MFVNDPPLGEDMAEEVGRPRVPQLPGGVRTNLDGRVHRKSDLNQQVHDLSMAHSSKVRRDHSQIYIAPRIGIPAGVGPKKNDLLDTNSLSQAIDGLPNYFFDASRRFNRFHRASVCAR